MFMRHRAGKKSILICRRPHYRAVTPPSDDRYFAEVGRQVIFTKVRDPRLVTVRRGGSLQDPDHRLLAVWAANCAMHVLHLFERSATGERPPAPNYRTDPRSGRVRSR